MKLYASHRDCLGVWGCKGPAMGESPAPVATAVRRSKSPCARNHLCKGSLCFGTACWHCSKCISPARSAELPELHRSTTQQGF